MTEFRRRQIGHTGLRVSELGLGFATLGGSQINVARAAAEEIGLDPTYGPPRCKGNFARSDLSSLRQPIRSQDLVLAKMEIRAPRSS